MLQEFNCTVIFDPLAETSKLCDETHTIKRALKKYRQTPVVERRLWLEKKNSNYSNELL